MSGELTEFLNAVGDNQDRGKMQSPCTVGTGESDRGAQLGGVGFPLAEQSLLSAELGAPGDAQPQG